MPSTLFRRRQIGLLCLLVAVVGWALNWLVMKSLPRKWPLLSAPGTAGITAALALVLLAAPRGQRLAVPVRSLDRLLLAAGLDVTA
jgi:drug/metabolite transporter (DMT)-like permease